MNMDYVDLKKYILNLTTLFKNRHYKNCNLWDINAISSKLCITYMFEIIIFIPLMDKIWLLWRKSLEKNILSSVDMTCTLNCAMTNLQFS